MQIVSLGVFNHSGQRRDVNFRLGALNILTGKSKTGKSAILDIAEYCLGRDTVTIPTGVISDNATWYYLLAQFQNDRMLICRPNPQTASTGRAMIRTGGLELGAPEFEDLEVNADTDVVRDILTERLGIESFTVEPEAGSLRQSFDVSARQALFYCFQSQNEIASRDVLFHRQVDNNVKATIKETLPYFLGTSTPEQSALQRQLIATRRILQRTLNRIRSIEDDLGEQDSRITHLLDSAVSLGVLPTEFRRPGEEGVRSLLERIRDFDPTRSDMDDSDIAIRRRGIEEEGRTIRRRLRDLDDQISVLDKLQNESAEAGAESEYQHERLAAIDLMLPKSSQDDGAITICPLCDQHLARPDETVSELRQLMGTLESRMSATEGASARRQETLDRLVGLRAALASSLRENVEELDAIAEQEEEIAADVKMRERIVFLQGRVSQELERGVDLSGDLTSLRRDERRFRGELARLEEQSELADPSAALRSAMDEISDVMTDFARTLQLEGSENFVRLDPVDLTVVIQQPGGRVPLSRMGSAENWVGYHLVAHLALHRWFCDKDRPVPRFVMFDQSTQAFFPEEVVDAADDENADWEAVRRQFALMRDVVANLDGQLQIIASDHANLQDDWFQEGVIENWRNGVALIPEDWLYEQSSI